MSELRIGLGVDAHAFGEGIPLVLGGVAIDHPRGLVGHSDGDVIAHALTDALLAEAFRQVGESGFALVNADCILIGEEPRIGPHREAMRDRLAAALSISRDQVNVRATTTDRLGFTGRREGLAAQAVALLRRR